MKPFPPARLHAELEHESRETFARICLMLETLGNSSVRNRATCPLAGTDNALLASTFPVLGSHNRARTYAAAVSGLAIAIPVFRTPSVSAAKSVAGMTSEAGLTPPFQKKAVAEDESRRNVLSPPQRRWTISLPPPEIAALIFICTLLIL